MTPILVKIKEHKIVNFHYLLRKITHGWPGNLRGLLPIRPQLDHTSHPMRGTDRLEDLCWRRGQKMVQWRQGERKFSWFLKICVSLKTMWNNNYFQQNHGKIIKLQGFCIDISPGATTSLNRELYRVIKQTICLRIYLPYHQNW